MRYGDPQAKNLFSRLFSYTPRSQPVLGEQKRSRQRNALEDFCTEALAWCLLNSEEFARRFLDSPAFKSLSGVKTFEVETQLQSFDVESEDDSNEEQADKARFDLVIKSSSPNPTVTVIECKVSFDSRENIQRQIETYRSRMKTEFLGYATDRQSVVLLTPYGEKYNADAHVSWSEVSGALQETSKSSSSATTIVLEQFASFLIERQIAKMKVQPFKPILPDFKNAAPMLRDLQDILGSLSNDGILRPIFSKASSIPKLDLYEHYLWYGIWSRGARPTYYAGFETARSGEGPLVMYAQVQINGGPPRLAMPSGLQKICDWQGPDERGTTSFIFKAPIDSAYDGDRAKIEGWFTSTLRAIIKWIDKAMAS